MKRLCHYFSLLIFLMVAARSFAGSPTSLTAITVVPNPQTYYCAGSTTTFSFAVDQNADPGNVFTAQLSDATGSFANPIDVGSVSSVGSNNIVATLPANTPSGTGYKLRVVSSSPVVISNSGPELTISQFPTVTIDISGGGTGSFCEGQGLLLTSDASEPGLTYKWRKDAVYISGATSPTYLATTSGSYDVLVSNSSFCAGVSNAIQAVGIPPPVGEITASGNILCPSGSIILNGSSTLAGTWYRNGTELPDAFTNAIVISVAGDYQWLPHTLSGCNGIISPVFSVISSPSFTTLAVAYALDAPAVTLTGSPAGGVFSGPGVSGNTFTPSVVGPGGPYIITYSYTVPPSVDNPTGCLISGTQQTSVTQGCTPPDAMITAAGSTNVCGNGSITLNANTGTGLSYQWQLNATNITGANSPSLVAIAAGNYTVIVTNSSACSATSLPITITASSSPDAIITPLGSTTVCAPGSVTLQANAGSGLSYQWQLDGTDIPGASFSTFSASASGSYVLIVTNAAGCSSTSSAVIVSINQPPAAFITAAGSTTFCSGGGVALITNSGNGLTYQWKQNGAIITGATGSTYFATSSGNYSVVVSSDAGCSAESGSVSVQSFFEPQGGIIVEGETTLCPGGSTVLIGTTSNGYWLLNGGQISGTFGNGLGVSDPGDYQWVPISIEFGCVGSPSPVTTISLLSASFTGLAPSFPSTTGPVTLTGSPSGGTFSGPGISGNTFNPSLAGVGGPYTITYTVTQNTIDFPFSCSASATSQTTVTGGCTPPAATISPAGSTTFCPGGTVLLNANTGTGLTYQWQVNGVNVAGSVGSSFVAVNSGSLTVVVTNSGGCSATSAPVIVTLNAAPDATITASGSTTFCTGANVTLNASTGSGFTYQWQTGGVNIGGATSSSFVASISGTYRVVIANSGGCRDTSSPVVITSNSLPSVSFTGLAAIYPPGAPAVTLTGDPAGGTFSGPGITGDTFNPATAGVGGPYTITYTYTNGNGCTNSISHQTTVGTVCPVPSIPGSISTSPDGTSVCPGDSRIYTIPVSAGATSYTWSAPPGADITSGQGSISAVVTYNAGFNAGDSLRVTANNSCGSSIARARKINRKAVPSSPLAISGPVTGICNISGIQYAVTPDPGNTYNWSWNTTGVSIASGQGTATMTSDFTTGFVSGKVSVTASNSCGTSLPRNLIVDAKPGVAATISGLAGVCANQQAVAYSTLAIVNATSYIWYSPTGSHINDGSTTSPSSSLATNATNVQVNFATTGGLIRVKGVNACVAGSVTSIPVSIVCREGLEVGRAEVADAGSVYPNPSNGLFLVKLPATVPDNTIMKIEIINQFGQMIYEVNRSSVSGIIQLELTGRLGNGIYLVNCTGAGQKMVQKIIISK